MSSLHRRSRMFGALIGAAMAPSQEIGARKHGSQRIRRDLTSSDDLVDIDQPCAGRMPWSGLIISPFDYGTLNWSEVMFWMLSPPSVQQSVLSFRDIA
nr:hypothetical protein CFP56_28779 [Quercus suber]